MDIVTSTLELKKICTLNTLKLVQELLQRNFSHCGYYSYCGDFSSTDHNCF